MSRHGSQNAEDRKLDTDYCTPLRVSRAILKRAIDCAFLSAGKVYRLKLVEFWKIQADVDTPSPISIQSY